MLGYYSLLAKLEDDEELPVGDKVEENEEDCDDSEDFEEGVGAIREVKENLQRDETSLPFSRRNSSLPQFPITSSTSCSMDEVLQLMRQL